MTRRKPSATVLKAALLVVCLLCVAGCIFAREEKVDLNAPIVLRPAARELRGVASSDVLVETATTVLEEPMRTRLIRDVAEGARRAVVSVYAATKTPYEIRLPLIPFLPGLPLRVRGIGLGSGFVIHPSGYILTNEHVIRHADKIRVLTFDGKDYGVKILAIDPVYDLALLRLEGLDRKLDVLPMGDSEEVGIGDFVIAIGNPLGLGHTVTSGIISQTGRHLTDLGKEGGRRIDYLQTNTAINLGSSGGPLVTLAGAWIGINTARAAQAEGIGFAAPSRQVKEFLDKVRAGDGKVVGR